MGRTSHMKRPYPYGYRRTQPEHCRPRHRTVDHLAAAREDIEYRPLDSRELACNGQSSAPQRVRRSPARLPAKCCEGVARRARVHYRQLARVEARARTRTRYEIRKRPASPWKPASPEIVLNKTIHSGFGKSGQELVSPL